MNIEVMRRLLEQNKLEPYIRHIRFPQYKNIKPFTQIDFTFPITALVGANGTNKSSLLKALYGAPDSNNLGNYWFSTDIDPILEGDNYPNCFVYGYLNQHRGNLVEVLKTRVKKGNDPDYWEPSRPIIRYGMEGMPEPDPADPNRSQTRWKAISKKADLLDFRLSLSAFDRYFYNGDFSQTKHLSHKKNYIRTRAPHLKSVLDNGLNKYLYYNVNRIVSGQNKTLTADELDAVKKILGRNYSEIKLVGHKFFQAEGYTARISNNDHNYTEAFAGSGEFAVVMLVTRIMRAEPKSLILLDEPEVSLHPGAQERLLDFLGDQVIKKKHQVIFTTHSPALIRKLPPDAIKVLSLEGTAAHVTLASQKSMPEEAFLQIGEPILGKKLVITEDRLAIEIIRRALRVHNPQRLQLLRFQHFSGGASVMFNNYVVPYSAENRSDILCLFDGDQRPASKWPKLDEISKINDDDLSEKIKILTGSEIKFPINSGDEADKKNQRHDAQRRFLGWSCDHVRYLPGNQSPEEFVLSKIDIKVDDDAKLKFVSLTRESLGLTEHEENPKGEAIFQEQCRRVAQIPADDQDLAEVARIIEEFMARGAIQA